MPNVISRIAEQLPQAALPTVLEQAGQALRHLIEAEAYVGEVVSLGYNDAIVQIHDYHRKQVGGIPALCFLIGTRVGTAEIADPREEDTSVILLRVIDQADLPNAEEARRVRVETAQRVSGENVVFGALFRSSQMSAKSSSFAGGSRPLPLNFQFFTTSKS